MNIFTLIVLFAATFGTAVTAFGGEPEKATPSKVLITYFSKTNNTKHLAEKIQSHVGGKMFHLTTAIPYPVDYRETTRIAREELDNNQRPELAHTISPEEMKEYDIIFIGYPNWWNTLPMAFFTFLEQFDWEGKTVVPFCTHGGGGLGRSISDIRTLCPGAKVIDALAVNGTSVDNADKEVLMWLRRSGLLKQ